MQAEDVAQRIKELTKVKICGPSTKGAVETVVTGADHYRFCLLHLAKDRWPGTAAELAGDYSYKCKKCWRVVSPSRSELQKRLKRLAWFGTGSQPSGRWLFTICLCASIRLCRWMEMVTCQVQADYLLFWCSSQAGVQTLTGGKLRWQNPPAFLHRRAKWRHRGKSKFSISQFPCVDVSRE